MYNVFLEEKRQRERAASAPEILSGAALKRREQLAQRCSGKCFFPRANVITRSLQVSHPS
jgi:hypothetical protein